METLSPRDVPLGGLRAMTVRRTLPQRRRTFIGAWCFVDHYGPDTVSAHGGMVVPPHPHTGLQTVSWLFSGEIEHRDSAGFKVMVRPGAVNLMTAGRGISHSEYSSPETTLLHGAQLWVALPDGSRDVAPDFEHFVPEPVSGSGWQARVFIGSLLGTISPVRTYTPLVGAELRMRAGTALRIPVDATFEHGILLDTGAITVDGKPLGLHDLGYLAPRGDAVEIVAVEDSLLLILGGAPFGEQIVMWWNFIGRSHDEIVEYRRQWQQLIDEGSSDRFVLPAADLMPPIPAPALPNVRLMGRG